MGAFQLETIEPPELAIQTAVPDLDHEEREAIRAAAYASGFQDGVDVTRTGMLDAQNSLLAVIRETVEDKRFDMERANATAEAAMLGYLEAIADTMVPGLLSVHFNEILMLRTKEVLSRALAGETTLVVAADSLDEISELVEEFGLDLKVTSNEDFEPGKVEFHWANGIDRLDLAAAGKEISKITAAYAAAVKEDDDERRRQLG